MERIQPKCHREMVEASKGLGVWSNSDTLLTSEDEPSHTVA